MANPPKLDPQRGARGRGIRLLPAKGRQGEVPDWPLYGAPTPAEADAWAELWATPQAAAWEELGWTRVVARYCVIMLLAETMQKDAMSEARQLEDRLGLTPRSMRLLLWQISTDDLAEKRQQESGGARGRIKAVG